MKPIIKKAISFILTLCLGFSISIPIHASEADETSKISELKGHWAEKTLTEWIRLGLLKGDNHGRYNPDSPITRAEFMALVNRVMNYTVKGDSIRNFTDVSPDKWYYDDASIALAIGYIKGTSATTLSPEDTITREQAITIISRIQGISPDGDTGILALFNDSAKISSWAAGSVAAAIREGLVTGSNGNINPDAQTTRCEAIVLLDRVRTNTRVYAFDSLVPTSTPSQAPTEVPTLAPTATPLPTQAVAPTQAPTQVPGSSPTTPIEVPTASPTKGPTAVPTAAPTAEPTADPTVTPEPTQTPSPTPTGIPDPASPPTKLTYPEARLSLANGTFYGRRVPVVEGGTPTVFEVSPALPDGISFDPNTGVLCGGNTKPTGISGLKNYTITAKNDAGSASFVIAIEVRPIITFTADPLSILKGDKATLTWNVQKVENIGYPAPVVTISNLGVQPRTGSVEVSPEQTTTYSLSVQSGEEYFPDVKTVTIQVGDDSMLPTPVISVGPSTTVEVGEAVIFDGRGSTDDKPLLGDDCLDNTFVWDYGDGSAVMSENWGHRSGPVSMHYFMKPGTFPVTLTVNDSDGYRASTTVNITVTGTAPMEGFEVLHAPFHSRIAQQILVHLPESVTADSANRMIATLQGPQGETKLLTKSGLSAEEVFLLDHRDLTKGDYVLEVELLNGDGQRLPGGIWREKFTKDYEGLPTVGIDENNAIRVNGELYFPVHNWAMNLASLPDYLSMKAIDGVFYLYTGQKATYSEEHGQWIPDLDVLKSSYQNYLEPNDLFGIVEDKWTGKGITEATLRNSDPNNIREYVASLKNSPSLFAWCWDDEPNLGSWTSGGVPPNVLAAWHHFTSVDDPLHPTLTNLAGYMYCSTSAYTMQKVEYMMKYSDKDLGKKVALADIIHGACFALEAYKSYPDPNDPSRGAIDVYTDYLKNRRDWNYNLLPTMAVTATCNIIPEDKVKYFGPPSPDEIRMITWLNIVYGVKGMNWYPYLGYLPAENFATMGEISQQIDELTPVILGPEEVAGISVSDNANIKGKNVKTMLRETDDAYYLFTVRLTEREWWDDPSIEPEQISATFELAGLSGNKTATEYLNHKKVFEEHGTKEGGTEFTFTLAQKPVPGSVSFGGVIEQDDRPYKKFCYVFDDGNGNLYANKYWKTGGTMPAGTIDYSTGEVTVFFPNMWNSKKELILPGEDCLIASYEPVRAERTVQIQNGTFTDTFNRNDVHIYRIPKN